MGQCHTRINKIPKFWHEALGQNLIKRGARFELLRKHLAINATYTQVIYLDREVAPRARDGAGKSVALLAPSRSPDGGGKYSQSVGLLSLAVEYIF